MHLKKHTDAHISNNNLKVGVLHDCNPASEDRQVEEYVAGKAWNGTVWKAWVEYRCNRKDLNMFVVDTDHGCGVIRKGAQKLWTKDPLNKCIEYTYLENHRPELLNLISVEEFNSNNV